MDRRVNRRSLIAGVAVAAPVVALATQRSSSASLASRLFQQADATPGASPVASPIVPATPIARIDSPGWVLNLLAFQDPYPGAVRAPASPFPNMPAIRYVAIEVLFENVSDQVLDVRTTDIRVHDAEGFEYAPAPGVSGAETKLQSQSVSPGDRARGWVWFTVPATAVLLEIRVDAPQVELRLPITAELNSVAIPVATPVA